MILETVQDYLLKASKGDATMSPKLVEEFGQSCKDAIDRQFNHPQKEWKPRPSGLGQAVCQQQLAKEGVESEVDYTRLFKFLMGDLIEAYAIAVMKAAGLPVEDEQKKVGFKLGETEIEGSLDLSLFQRTWDVKSASSYSAKKFGEFGGYDAIKKDDPFGYVVQGNCYGKAAGMPFAGWIVIDKSNGEWVICEVPDYVQKEEEAAALKVAEENLDQILNHPFKRLFEDFPEERKEDRKVVGYTGNRRLAKECGFCDYKRHCWPDCEVHRDVGSTAKNPNFVWYSKLVKKG